MKIHLVISPTFHLGLHIADTLARDLQLDKRPIVITPERTTFIRRLRPDLAEVTFVTLLDALLTVGSHRYSSALERYEALINDAEARGLLANATPWEDKEVTTS